MMNCSRQENAGIELLLTLLDRADGPVYLNMVGSCRVVAAALNREPGLLKEKTRALLLNAGSVEGGTAVNEEYNVRVDPHAWRRIGRGDLPIWWFPCSAKPGAHYARQAELDQHATFWTIEHHKLLKDLDPRLQKWFFHGLTGNLRGDLLRALHDNNQWGAWWGVLLQATRQLWSTASMVLAAGRNLYATSEGARFLPESTDAGTAQLSMEPIDIHMDAHSQLCWKKAPHGSHRIFRRRPGPEHITAMGDALVALLREIPS